MKKSPSRSRSTTNESVASPLPIPVRDVAFALALLAATLLAYRPAWHGGMIWDDEAHMTAPDLRSADGLWRIWFEPGSTQQHYPLTFTVFWLQYQLWGADTLGYHLANIVLHAGAALLFTLILKRLDVPGAYLGGVIFALHPVHVESVAWISELKNTLSGVLYLGAGLTYLYFDQRRNKGLYAGALALFVLALLSKTVTATLPAALLVVFWWQRGRLSWRHDVLPLVPFFVIGVTAGLGTVWIERVFIGAEGTEYELTAIERCLIAGRVIWFYLGKLVWPAELIFIYPRWEINETVWWQYLFPLATVGFLLGLWLVRKRTRAPLAALLLFCGTLFPVLGFFNVYPFAFSFVADHFQYLASLGVIALFAACVARVVGRWQLDAGAGYAFIVVGLLIGGALGALTWAQSRQYADFLTLFRETIRRNPSCWMAHNNLGSKLAEMGYIKEAVDHFQAALQIKPDFADPHNNLGRWLSSVGNIEDAELHFQEALRLKPNFAEAQFQWGNALKRAGKTEEAMTHYEAALRIKPNYADAHYNLGNALLNAKRFTEAVTHYEKVLRLKPNFADAHFSYGSALLALNRVEEAVTQYREALRINPNYAAAYYYLGNILQSADQLQDAIEHYQKALWINPNFPEAEFQWGNVLVMQRRFEDAEVHFEQALQLKPDYPAARDMLRKVQAGKGP